MIRKNTGPSFWRATEKARREADRKRRREETERVKQEAYQRGFSHGRAQHPPVQIPSGLMEEIFRELARQIAIEVHKQIAPVATAAVAAYSRMIAERVVKEWGHNPTAALEAMMIHDPAHDSIRFVMTLPPLRVGYEVSRFDLYHFRPI